MVKKNLACWLLAMFAVTGVIWLFYVITVPTFDCREVNKTPKTPVEVFGSRGIIRSASPEILDTKFRYRVDITNLSLSWKKYKKAHGGDEYVHSYSSGGVTILTNDPSHVWKFIKGDKIWIRVTGWPINCDLLKGGMPMKNCSR